MDAERLFLIQSLALKGLYETVMLIKIAVPLPSEFTIILCLTKEDNVLKVTDNTGVFLFHSKWEIISFTCRSWQDYSEIIQVLFSFAPVFLRTICIVSGYFA